MELSGFQTGRGVDRKLTQNGPPNPDKNHQKWWGAERPTILDQLLSGLGQAMARAWPARPQAGTSISAELQLTNLGSKSDKNAIFGV